MSPVIQMKNVTKVFTHVTERSKSVKSFLVSFFSQSRVKREKRLVKVLDDVSLDIFPGEVVGILGRNGTGKSTLFRLLSGIYEVTAGQITITEKVAPLVGLGAGFHSELTGYENILLNGSIIGFSRAQMLDVMDEIIAFSELGNLVDLPVKNYSNGMVLRLGFAIAVHINAPILLLDEILGVGDEGFQRKSLNKVREVIRSGRTIVMVTHDTSSILEHCTRCIVLDGGKVRFDGPPQEGVAVYSRLFT